jgi:hypothetical protein
MAKSMLLKTKPKKKTVVRQSKLADEKYTGLAPNFNAANTWSEQKLKDEWRRGMYYYNYHYTCSDLRKYVSQLGTSKYNWSKQDVYAFNECEDHRIGITLCAIAKMSMDGAPAIEDDTDKFINKKFTDLLAYGHSQLAAKTPFANVVKLTIQDRMREKLSDVIGEIEEWYDKADAGKEVPDMVAWMREHNVPQQFVNQIAEVFTPRMEELLEAKSKTADEQLKEGYRHVDKAKLKQLSAFYDKLTGALETYGAVKKAVRKARVKKPPSKEKLVKNVKYCVQHTELNLVSINPVDVLGATQLWVYNIKTRKLGRYIAATDAGQLSIKGSAIIGFDSAASIAKTLRKPPEQLKQFANAGKVTLRSFIEDIKSVAVNLNGRLGNDWVLLKAVK